MTSDPYVWLALPTLVMVLGSLLMMVWTPSRSLIALEQHVAAGILLAIEVTILCPFLSG